MMKRPSERQNSLNFLKMYMEMKWMKRKDSNKYECISQN